MRNCKYHNDGYQTVNLNLKDAIPIVNKAQIPNCENDWMLSRYQRRVFWKRYKFFASENNTLSPYLAVAEFQKLINHDAIVTADCGAHLLVSEFFEKNETIYTAAGFDL